MPAAPSVTVLSAPFSMRNASGDLASSSRAQLTVSSSSDASGTTVLTSLISRDGENDHTNAGVVARDVERVREFEEGRRPERVPHFRPVYRDLRDAFGGLIEDVGVVLSWFRAGPLPFDHS